MLLLVINLDDTDIGINFSYITEAQSITYKMSNNLVKHDCRRNGVSIKLYLPTVSNYNCWFFNGGLSPN